MTTIHISLDLETWGKRPGCDIRSIGACVFDPLYGYVASPSGDENNDSKSFYIATDNPAYDAPQYVHDGQRTLTYPNGEQWYHDNVDKLRKYPLRRDPSTVQWWSEQTAEAQAAFTDPVDLRIALLKFSEWLIVDICDNPPIDKNGLRNVAIWSHGAAFDPPILEAAYHACGLPVPWHYRAPRDTRTAFDMADVGDHSAFMQQFNVGTAHHALDDAISQARCICAAYQRNNRHCVALSKIADLGCCGGSGKFQNAIDIATSAL